MINGKRILGVIPARGGSKRLPRKNVLPLAGKPLIAWTIEAGKASKYIDRLIVSTDDEEIAEVARAWGCEVPFMRPPELASDDTPTMAVIRHAIGVFEDYEYVVVLQPTSPLRLAEDIDGCVEDMIQHGASTCVSISEVGHPPQWMFQLGRDRRLRPMIADGSKVTRRQDASAVYALNGAIYVGRRKNYQASDSLFTNDTLAYIMPKERSVDVDTLFDLKFCEWLMENPDLSLT